MEHNKTNLKCYMTEFIRREFNDECFNSIIFFAKNINEAMSMLTDTFTSSTNEEIDNVHIKQIDPNKYNLKCPDELDFRLIKSTKTKRDPKDGLYPDEVMELMNYIQKNNSWENMYDCHMKNRETPKYYTMRVDTRTGTVWMVTFDNLVYDKCEETFRTEQNYNFKEAIYEFLNKERKEE